MITSLFFTVHVILFLYCPTVNSSCIGYECFKQYVDKKDSVYQWEDTGHRLHGLDPLHIKLWTGLFEYCKEY